MHLFRRDTSGLPFLDPRFIQRACYLLSCCCFFLAGALYVLVPLEAFQAVLSGAAPSLNKYQAFAVFIFLLMGVTAFLLSQVFQDGPKKNIFSDAPQAQPRRRLLGIFQLVASLLILSQTISQIRMPFDLDENQRAAAAVTKSFLHEINPFRHTEVHAVAHVAAITSMKIFGKNKVAFRLPSILFTIGFLIVLNLFANRFLSPFASILVFGHLLVNEMTLWYMHAMRGYISSMFFTTILLYILLESTRELPARPRQRLLLFFSAFVLSILSHPFTGIFALLTMLTFVQWLWLQKDRLSADRLGYASQLISVATLLIPFSVWVFVCVLKSLEPIANVHAGGFEKFVEPLFQTLPALGRAWAVRALAALLLYAGVLRLIRNKRLELDFYTLFVGNSFFFFASVLLLLKVSHLEPRWFIPFLVPFLFWTGEWMARIPQRVPRWGVMALSFALLTALPVKMRYGILDRLGIWYHQRYENFLAQVREQTGPVSENCYEFPEIPMGDWAEEFHFIDAPKTPEEKARCRNRYLVSLELAPVKAPPSSTVVLDAGNGNVAYLLKPNP